MTNRFIENIEKPHLKSDVPQFSVGDTVDVHTRIVEGDKERIQVFSGTVIMRKGKGINETFTVSTASKSTGAIMTMPGPPPKGLSSTDRCASVAKSRKLVKWYDTSLFSAARFGMLVPRNGPNISGNRVRMSIRIGMGTDIH